MGWWTDIRDEVLGVTTLGTYNLVDYAVDKLTDVGGTTSPASTPPEVQQALQNTVDYGNSVMDSQASKDYTKYIYGGDGSVRNTLPPNMVEGETYEDYKPRLEAYLSNSRSAEEAQSRLQQVEKKFKNTNEFDALIEDQRVKLESRDTVPMSNFSKDKVSTDWDNYTGAAPTPTISAGTATASQMDISGSLESLDTAINTTNAWMEIPDSYINDFSSIYGSPGTNMNDYFDKYKPEQLEAQGLAGIKQEFTAAADSFKEQMAQSGLSGSGIEAGVLNDINVSQAEALSTQRVNNVNSYYDKLMSWNQFEATSKIQLLGQELSALGMSNSLTSTYAQLQADAERTNAQLNTDVSKFNATSALNASIANADIWKTEQQFGMEQARIDSANQQFNINRDDSIEQYKLDRGDRLQQQQLENTLSQDRYNDAFGLDVNRYESDYSLESWKVAEGISNNNDRLDAEKQASKNNLLGSVVGLSASALVALSDIRLKRNIVRIGRDSDKGLDLYSWDWVNDNIDYPKSGYLAQEVREKYPDAVIYKNGFEMIHLGRL